jgi:flagellar assembly protein FliH
MTSSKPAPRPVPAPPGGAARSASYSRFIPREELADFAAWTPDALAGQPRPAGPRMVGGLSAGRPAAAEPPAAPPPAPAGPTPEEWQARVADSRQQGYQDGYRDGLEALEAAKQQHAMQVSAQMAQVVAAFQQQVQALEARMADAVTDTAVSLARQVVRAELAERPQLVAQVAREAIGAVMMSARHLRLRLNPQDLELVQLGAGDALRAREVLLLSDAAVSRGGCTVESDLGQVDAAIEHRWARAAAVLGSELPLDLAAGAQAAGAAGAAAQVERAATAAGADVAEDPEATP